MGDISVGTTCQKLSNYLAAPAVKLLRKRRAFHSQWMWIAYTVFLAIEFTAHFSPVARAENSASKSYPTLDATMLIELQNDTTVASDENNLELNDLYNTIGIGVGIHFNRYLTVHGAFTSEPVRAPTGDRILQDHGLYAEELFIELKPISGLRIFGGKFNPAFGTAWGLAPGVYGVDFAEDYEITERMGFGFEASADATPLGAIALTTGIYQTDRTQLSRSLFTDRARPV